MSILRKIIYVSMFRKVWIISTQFPFFPLYILQLLVYNAQIKIQRGMTMSHFMIFFGIILSQFLQYLLIDNKPQCGLLLLWSFGSSWRGNGSNSSNTIVVVVVQFSIQSTDVNDNLGESQYWPPPLLERQAHIIYMYIHIQQILIVHGYFF